MKRALLIFLFACLVFPAGQSARLTSSTAGPRMAVRALSQGESTGDLTQLAISKFEWVDKRCRMWAPDGEIDVDQTCLVLKTVRGGALVIPNEYNDAWLKEMTDHKANEDKWIQRFFAIGGGAKTK